MTKRRSKRLARLTEEQKVTGKDADADADASSNDPSASPKEKEEDEEDEMVEVNTKRSPPPKRSSRSKRKAVTSSPYFGNKKKSRSSIVSPSSSENTDEAASDYLSNDQQLSQEQTVRAARELEVQVDPTNGDGSVDAMICRPAGQPDGKGGLFVPYFRVEYSKSSRATCRRCDDVISKGSVRVAHRPLFRGKPGFEIYRHLKCAVFNEDVKKLDDVGGASDLEDEDQVALKKRMLQSLSELREEQTVIDPDELVAKAFDGKIIDAPEGITADLLPFQKVGLSWLYAQETNEGPGAKSSILADEMGMGKTLQTITLIVKHRPKLQHAIKGRKVGSESSLENYHWNTAEVEWSEEMDKSDVPRKLRPKKGPLRGGTLVVCPVIALKQWKSEIEKFTNGCLTIGIYHGQKRSSQMPRELLQKYDVVLTTYQVIEADFRKMAAPNKVKCPNCGKKFKIDKLKLHLKYYCGEFAERTEAQARQVRASDRNGRTSNRSRSFGRNSPEENGGKKAKKTTKKVVKRSRKGKDDDSSSDFEDNTDQVYSKKESKKNVKKLVGKHSKKKGEDDSSSDYDDDAENIDIDMDKLIREAQMNSCMSVLHGIVWWRIVLDEAHMIKSRSSQTAAASFALIGVHRLCLTGTPLQNRVGEFYSLVRFLRMDQMAHYYCRAKGCDCKSLHYRMFEGKCKDCGHSSVQHYSHFNKYVLNPIKRDGYSGDGRRAMFVLKEEVLDRCLLRRTKETNAADMNLPNRLTKIREVKLHPVEEDFYNTLYTQSKTAFNDYAAQGTLLNNYAHIFDLLIRMRQAVDHPYLVLYSKKSIGNDDMNTNTTNVANGSTVCDLCREDPADRVVSSCCSAAFCRNCVVEYMATAAELQTGNNGIPCPSCHSPFSIDLNVQDDIVENEAVASEDYSKSKTYNEDMPMLKSLRHVPSGSVLRRINLAEFATSTKIEALAEELVKMRHKSPGSKAIVFSQFVNMLDLIRWRLHSDPCLAELGLGVASLHGGMNVKVREENIRSFKEDSDVKVLLVSLKAGGVALNLTVANYVFLMDPWWNPAAEMQAIDRTHRIGQYRPIRAIRFIAANTVESKILQLQEKKRLVFDGTVGRDAASLKALTADDMKSLFS